MSLSSMDKTKTYDEREEKGGKDKSCKDTSSSPSSFSSSGLDFQTELLTAAQCEGETRHEGSHSIQSQLIVILNE